MDINKKNLNRAIWQQAAHTTYHLSSPSCSTPVSLGGGGGEVRGERETHTQRELYLEFVSRFSLTSRVMLIVHCSVHNRSSLNANVWYTWYYFTNVRPSPPPPPPTPFLFVCLFVCLHALLIYAFKQASYGLGENRPALILNGSPTEKEECDDEC